jgi:Twin arginine targeting (Tat) protein translocase TatC
MSSSDERKEASASATGNLPGESEAADSVQGADAPVPQPQPAPEPDPYAYDGDAYGYEEQGYSDGSAATTEVKENTPPPSPSAPPPPPPFSKDPDEEEEDDEEEDMLRMSFLEHLEELRSRIIKCLIGLGIAFAASLTFTEALWRAVSAPAAEALRNLGLPPNLVAITPMEQFNTIWIKLPILTSLFLASPWILYQVWAFVAPGLYKRERRWAAPFVIVSAGLFIAGGLFAYFVAFRFGLTFLLGIGRDVDVLPLVSISYYFDLFVNVVLGVALVFELPVLVFFLTLLRITSPQFLLSNSRYAILAIVVLAAVVTPTPDVINLTIFAAPMVVLYFVGVFASYLLVLSREKRKFPWTKVILAGALILAVAATILYFVATKYGYKFIPAWPFLTK